MKHTLTIALLALTFSCLGPQAASAKDVGVIFRRNVPPVEFAVNEISQAGFTALPSRRVRPPRIAEAPVAFECRLLQMLDVGRGPQRVVIGEVVYFHYHDGIVDEQFHVDVGRINPIGRLAGSGGYTRITDRFEMDRLKYDAGR